MAHMGQERRFRQRNPMSVLPPITTVPATRHDPSRRRLRHPEQSRVVTRQCPNGVVAFALIETVCSLRDPTRYSCREGTALGAQFLTAGIGLTNSR